MACLLNPARRSPSWFCTAAAPAIAFAAATFVIGVAGAAADTGAGAGEVVLAAATRGAAAGSAGEAFGAAPDVYARDEGLAVRSRPHPEYDPLGVRLGAFLVFPRLVATVEGDDNILATPTNTVSDAVFAFAPGFLARSDWNQNAVSLDANLVARQYVAHTAQDSVQ